MPKQLTIKQLLLLAFLLAGLLPAMIVSFLGFFQAREALKKEISHDMQTLSQAVANDISRMMFERVQNVRSWSGLSIMQEAQYGDVDKRLSIFLQELNVSYGGIYSEISVVNQDGIAVASSNPARIGNPLALAKPWLENEQSTQSVHFLRIEHGVLSITTPVQNTADLFTLVAQFNWHNIETILNNSVQAPTAAALIADQSVLSHTSNWKEIDSKHTMRVKSRLLQHPLPLNWHIEVDKLHSVAVAPANRLGWIFLALLITTLISALILVRPIANHISKPLAQLTQYAMSYTQKRSAAPPTEGPAEVQMLSNAFNTMTKDLAQYEVDLTRAAKLAVAGEMAAAMSHEVRTPLGILRSSADVLAREKGLSTDGKEVLGFIVSETDRLNKLVSTLIDAARPKKPLFVDCDINDLIRHAVGLLGAQAKAKNITINFTPNHVGLMKLDTDLITQVIMNLTLNALQILPNDGHIKIDLTSQEAGVMLCISDNGPGVAPEHQAHIFEPFFTQRAGGVGLGLAIVQQIVQTHSGTISYSTSEQNGAKFSIYLPRQ
jgi:two-component system, NtrC family, sensor histidine kinase HydH